TLDRLSDTTYLILAAVIVSSKSACKHPLLTDCGPLALPLCARIGHFYPYSVLIYQELVLGDLNAL
ncbi:hypothetical protein, partial [Pantoea ananatis]